MTHYQVLGVAPSASADEVRAAYLALARRHHPDVAGGDAEARRHAERRMQEVNQAWATLRDPGRRRHYDAELARLERGSRPSAAPASDPGVRPDRPADRERSPYGRRGRAPSGASADFVPFYEGEELDPEDLDDTPIGSRPVPRWVQLLPPGLLVVAFASLAVGLVVQFPPLFALGAVAFGLGTVSFLIAPLIALSHSSRRG